MAALQKGLQFFWGIPNSGNPEFGAKKSISNG